MLYTIYTCTINTYHTLNTCTYTSHISYYHMLTHTQNLHNSPHLFKEFTYWQHYQQNKLDYKTTLAVTRHPGDDIIQSRWNKTLFLGLSIEH